MTIRRVGARNFIGTIALGGVGMTLGVQAVAPGLPEMQQALELSTSEIGLVMTAYVLPGVVLTVPLGLLGDVIGRRFLFCLSLFVSGLAALVAGSTTSFALLLAMRTLQGIGFAAVMPLTITLLGEAFVGRDRLRAFVGRNAILTGSDVFLPAAGAFLAGLSWRAPLLVQAVTIPLALYAFTIMNESRSRPTGRERYARALLGILRAQPAMFSILLMQFSRFAFKFVLLAYLPILLVNQLDASVGHVGVLISLAAIATVITTTRVPRLLGRIPASSAVIASILGIAASIASFGVIPDWRWAIAGALVYGVGDGVLAVFSDAYAMQSARSRLPAGMVSISQTARNLGKLASPVAMAGIAAITSLPVAFLVMAVIGAAIAPAMLPLRRMDSELEARPESKREEAETEVREPLSGS